MSDWNPSVEWFTAVLEEATLDDKEMVHREPMINLFSENSSKALVAYTWERNGGESARRFSV